MTIEIVISSAIVSAAITVIGSIIAAKISQKTAIKTAREAAGNEIEKMRLGWCREDVVSSDEEFSEMAAAVARYISSGHNSQKCEALAKVAAIRAKENLQIGSTLDLLYKSISSQDLAGADAGLSAAISIKRAYKEQDRHASQDISKAK